MSRGKAAPSKELLDRFTGSNGLRLLHEVLLEQKIVGGNAGLATDLVDEGELVPVSTHTTVIEQGGNDNHVFLILAGAFDIIVNGKRVARRYPGDHIGEMAAIQPAQPRSATVVATEDSVLLKVSEPQLAQLGDKYPGIYRSMAKELARRLLQRNAFVTARREKIHIFIMSSKEAVEIARAVQTALADDGYEVFAWPDGVFRASQYAVESLERELDRSDFAIAIAQPDDTTKSRGKSSRSPRDNVIFELGLFIGRIGRHRSLLLEPRGEEIKLPSDLTGLTTIAYRVAAGRDLAAALAPACNRIREIIKELGPNN
jgi:CRP/FNR family cyclic AMP-dependent transcriptional regulator